MDNTLLVKRVVVGQCLAFCMAATGVFSSLLVEDQRSFPLLQSLTAYTGVTLVFLPTYFVALWRLGHHDDDEEAKGAPSPLPSSSLDDDGGGSELSVSSRPTSSSLRSLSSFLSRNVRAFRRRVSRVRYRHFTPFDRPWRYALIGIVDLEANYVVVKAYQYTNMTSVQLLDCFTILFVLVLSFVVLGSRPGLWQFIGAVIAVGGLSLLIVLDADGQSRSSEAPNVVLGDALCIVSSALYALSNVLCEKVLRDGTHTVPVEQQQPTDTQRHHQEEERGRVVHAGPSSSSPLHNGDEDEAASQQQQPYTAADCVLVGPPPPPLSLATVTTPLSPEAPSSYETVPHVAPLDEAPAWLPTLEYLALMPPCAFVFGLIQFLFLEFNDLQNGGNWSGRDVGYQLGYGIAMILIYGGMPLLFLLTSATFANLSLLTSDVYSIFWNVLIFSIYPKWPFFIAYSVIVLGIVTYATKGTMWEWCRVRLKAKCGS